MDPRTQRTALLASALALGLQGCASAPKDKRATLDIRPKQTAVQLAQPNDNLYSFAAAAIEKGDYGRALEFLQAASERGAEDVRILNAYGVVYDALGRFDLSERYYAKAQALDPGSQIVAHNIAYSQALQGKAAPTAFAEAASPPAPVSAEPADTSTPLVIADLTAVPIVTIAPQTSIAAARPAAARVAAAPRLTLPVAAPAPQPATPPAQVAAQSAPVSRPAPAAPRANAAAPFELAAAAPATAKIVTAPWTATPAPKPVAVAAAAPRAARPPVAVAALAPAPKPVTLAARIERAAPIAAAQISRPEPRLAPTAAPVAAKVVAVAWTAPPAAPKVVPAPALAPRAARPAPAHAATPVTTAKAPVAKAPAMKVHVAKLQVAKAPVVVHGPRAAAAPQRISVSSPALRAPAAARLTTIAVSRPAAHPALHAQRGWTLAAVNERITQAFTRGLHFLANLQHCRSGCPAVTVPLEAAHPLRTATDAAPKGARGPAPQREAGFSLG